MESLRKASRDVEATNSAMKRILISLMEGNAEHALAQENAIVATSGLALVARSATDAVVDFRRLMEEVGLNVVCSRWRHLEAKAYLSLDRNGHCPYRHGASARRGHR
jgi:hypothetical protein